MSEKNLHIISFDIPYPPDYGGVIDVFCKIKALSEAGIKIHLHCFEYGRDEKEELNKICESVNYYPRKISKSLLFNKLPYIVASRTSEELLKNLSKNNFPVLMEGLHSTYYLYNASLRNRKIIVRTHNIEHTYYENLAKVENNIFKKYYFQEESKKLKNYECVLKNATSIAAISENDFNYFSAKYKNSKYIPAFHPHEKVESKNGKGNFVFYHGNLAVGENNEAALFLANMVFNDLKIPFIIAGNKPSRELRKSVKKYAHIKLKENVNTEKIYELIKEAHINILPTFQQAGIKLKFLSALFCGRHCIVNSPMVENTGLEELCTVTDTAGEMKKNIKKLFEKNFTDEEIQKREVVLSKNFSNKKNAEKLIQLVN